jgi:ankyrin repeat protein
VRVAAIHHESLLAVAAVEAIQRGDVEALLGLMDRVEAHVAAGVSDDDITQAFLCACHGGQRRPAEHLLERGAEVNRVGYDDLTPLDAAVRSEAHELAAWVWSVGGASASP